MSEEINLKAIHQLQEYCQQANKKIGELNKQLKQSRAEVIEEVKEMISKQRFIYSVFVFWDNHKRYKEMRESLRKFMEQRR